MPLSEADMEGTFESKDGACGPLAHHYAQLTLRFKAGLARAACFCMLWHAHVFLGQKTAMIELTFHAGTLELRGADGPLAAVPGAVWDPRTAALRAEGMAYADAVRGLVRGQIPYEDRARAYSELARGLVLQREPRPYQAEAMAAWERARGRGVVVLPTGAGKTQVGLMAIDRKRRSTLVVAPTLDLVR
ncbi:MAG: hypothetical protein RL385_1822, partial [Pseudomonadota bacterium]